MLVRKINVLFLMVALSGVTVLLSGCLKNVENTPPRPKAYFSFMHLAPKSPSVEIFFGTEKVSGAFTPGGYTERYSEIDPGIFSQTFKKSGSDSVVASISSTRYDSLHYYTILLYNPPGMSSVQAQAFEDDFSVLTQDKAYYRFWHMSPDIGDVDVYANNELWEQMRSPADNVLGSYYYNQFQGKTANSYTITVKKAGTDSVIATANTTLYNMNAYTIFLKGVPGGQGANAVGINVLQASN